MSHFPTNPHDTIQQLRSEIEALRKERDKLKAMLQSAPQPDPVDVEPVAWLTPDGEGWRMRFEAPVTETKLGWMPVYEHPDPEVAKLRAQLAVAREALKEAERYDYGWSVKVRQALGQLENKIKMSQSEKALHDMLTEGLTVSEACEKYGISKAAKAMF